MPEVNSMFDYRPMRSIIYVDCVREEYRHRLQFWLYDKHIPDSISKFGPYVSKYAFYNALPTPPQGEREPSLAGRQFADAVAHPAFA